MPIGIKFSNFAFSTLAVGCNTTATTLALATGTGVKFPALAAGEYFYATLENASLDREVVKVTARSTDTITVVRGQDNTTARSWNAGDSIALRLNAGALDDFKAEVVDATNLIRTSNNTFTGTNTFNTAPTFGTDLAISDGGTGASTALAAFDNIKQPSSTIYSGVVTLATTEQAIAGTALFPVLTPATFRDANIVNGIALPATGTSVDFLSIPGWAKRITIMLSDVSTNGTSAKIIQVGGTLLVTSGYRGTSSFITSTVGSTAFTAGFGINSTLAADSLHGTIVITALDTFTWTASGVLSTSNAAATITTAGSITLAGSLSRVRLTTVSGANTFDAGTVNISWE